MVCDTISDPLCILQHQQVYTDKITVIDTVHRVILDSVTVKALENSQTFYNDAFDSLLFKVSIVLCIIGTLVAIVGIFLGIVRSNKEKEFEKTSEKMLNLEKKLIEQTEMQRNEFEKIKTDIEELKKEIGLALENERGKIQDKFNVVYRKLAETCFSSAEGKIENKDWFMHFADLSNFYFTLSKMTILTEYELYLLKATRDFLNKYEYIIFPYENYVPKGQFFHSLLLLIESSEKINSNFSIEAKLIYNELLKIFTYDKVKKSIENYLNDAKFDNVINQKILILTERYRSKP